MDSTKQILDTVRSFLDSPTEPSPFVLASKKFNYSISNEVNEDPHCKSFHVSDIDQAKSILKSVIGKNYDEQATEDNIEGFEFNLSKPLYLVIHKVN